MTTLRPLAIGEIIDRSATFWRSHWKPLFQVYLGFQLAQYAATKAFTLATRQALGHDVFNVLEWAKNPPQIDDRQLITLGVSVIAFIAFATVLAQAAAVASSAFILPRMLGQPETSVAQSLVTSVKRLGSTIGATLFSFVIAAAVGLVMFLPTIGLIIAAIMRSQPWMIILAMVLGGAASAVLFLWFLLRFILVAQVVTAEPLSAWGVIRRTGALSSGRVGPGFFGWVKTRLTVLITIVLSILFVVSSVTGFPVMLVAFLSGNAFDPFASAAPVWVLVPAELFQAITTAMVTPLYVVFQVVFYLDMRVRREGLDLELAAAKS